MKNVSNDFKIRTKKIKQQNAKLTIIEKTVAQEVRLVSDITYYNIPVSILKESNQVIAKELKYSFDGKLFKTIMKQIEITVKNANEIKDKNINFQYGLYIKDAFEYVDLGDFYIKDVEDDKGKEELVVTGYDKMINFMKRFKQSKLQLNYPCSILTLVQKICEVCGVELYSTNFFNSDLQVDEDYFTAQEVTYRDVLEKIAQSTLTTAFIKDNKLYFHHISGEALETLDKSYLSNLVIKEKFGPVNALVLGRGDVEDNIESKDDESITKNGRCEIRFDENELVEYKREQVIDNMFEQIKGLEYYSFESSDVGIMWLEPCDLIEVRDREDNSYKTIYLKTEIIINTGIRGNIEADVIEETNTEYKVTTKEEKKTLKVERLAKKNEGKIQDLVQETTDQNQKISQVTQTVNELNSKIGDIADITTSKETINATLSFEKINQSEPIYVRIYPTGENISYLYPRENLYPSETLFMTVRTLRFTNTTTKEYVDYELPTDLLYYDAESYDEFILDYDAQSCEVNKRVGYNADGTTYVLDTPQTIKYEYPRIDLTDGDYVVELLGYHNAYLFVRLMAQNMYTTQWATKAELNSEISQTAESINLSVDKKLTSYPTTTQMNSAISLKANEITSSVNEKLEGYDTSEEVSSKIQQSADSITSAVSSTYATKTELTTAKSEIKQTTDSISSTVLKKVGNDEVISKINQSSETVGIDANKIELSANDILNLLAGNQINLTSKNIIITSDHFKVDEEGNLTITSDTGGAVNAQSRFTIQTSDGQSVGKIFPNILLYNTSQGSAQFGVFGYPRAYLRNATSGELINLLTPNSGEASIYLGNDYNNAETVLARSGITTPTLTQTSKESKKKNIEEYKENALDIVKNSKIYEFNFKGEEDNHKKHLGFVIGDEGGNYKTPEQVISNDREGIENSNMTSILWKSFQDHLEQYEEKIEQLQKEIKQLKGEN